MAILMKIKGDSMSEKEVAIQYLERRIKLMEDLIGDCMREINMQVRMKEGREKELIQRFASLHHIKSSKS